MITILLNGTLSSQQIPFRQAENLIRQQTFSRQSEKHDKTADTVVPDRKL